MLCERSYDPLKDAVEGAMRGCKIWKGGGVTSNGDRSLTISVPSTQRRVIFQSPCQHGGCRPDSLIRRGAPLSKNGPLLTNLRVVLNCGVHPLEIIDEDRGRDADQSLYSSMLATAALRASAHWLESFR